MKIKTTIVALLLVFLAYMEISKIPTKANNSSRFDILLNTGEIISYNDFKNAAIPQQTNWQESVNKEKQITKVSPEQNQQVVDNTKAQPYSTVAHIIIQTSNGSGMCTGSFISLIKVITAAHCVYDRKTKQMATSVQVIPSRNGVMEEPHGRFISKKFYIPFGYTQPNWQSDIDLAVIDLDTPIGYQTGWFGMNPIHNLNQEVILTGYPGDKKSKMYTQTGKIFEPEVSGNVYETKIKVVKGNSGSPVYNKQNQIIGLATQTTGELGVITPLNGANYKVIHKMLSLNLKDNVEYENGQIVRSKEYVNGQVKAIFEYYPNTKISDIGVKNIKAKFNITSKNLVDDSVQYGKDGKITKYIQYNPAVEYGKNQNTTISEFEVNSLNHLVKGEQFIIKNGVRNSQFIYEYDPEKKVSYADRYQKMSSTYIIDSLGFIESKEESYYDEKSKKKIITGILSYSTKTKYADKSKKIATAFYFNADGSLKNGYNYRYVKGNMVPSYIYEYNQKDKVKYSERYQKMNIRYIINENETIRYAEESYYNHQQRKRVVTKIVYFKSNTKYDGKQNSKRR